MEFYTVLLRQSAGDWVALCLENGLVGQRNNPEESISKIKEADRLRQLGQFMKKYLKS